MKAVKFFAALGVAVSLFAAGLGIVNASGEPDPCTHPNFRETTSVVGTWQEKCDKDERCVINYTEYIRVQVCSSCGKFLGSNRWTYYKHTYGH